METQLTTQEHDIKYSLQAQEILFVPPPPPLWAPLTQWWTRLSQGALCSQGLRPVVGV